MKHTHPIQAYYEGLVEPIYRAVSGTVLHLAMFEEVETREAATTRTKVFLAARLPALPVTATIVDLGSGYGDTARFLAQRCGCRVIGLNLIHSQNVRALGLNREARLDGSFAVIEADFAGVPLPSACAEVVWSQEALLHAPDRKHVLAEAVRLLRPGGTLILTDILQTGPMTDHEARLIYERVKIDSLETFDSYRSHLQAVGLQLDEVVDLSPYVARSYADHIDGLRRNRPALIEAAGADYVDYTIEAMGRWVRAAEKGKLGWGMFVARKL